MAPKIKNCGKSEKGQALLEASVSAPLFLAFLLSVSAIFAAGWLHLELVTLTREFGLCLQNKKIGAFCRSGYNQSLSALPGDFRLTEFRVQKSSIQTVLRHRLPLLSSRWSIHVKLPQY